MVRGKKGSHPPSVIRAAERLMRDRDLVASGDRVLCGLSGGPDSTALVHVLASLRERLGLTVEAAGVDHGLRADAEEELELAARTCRALDVPFERLRVDVASGENLQARARTARHRALQEAAGRASAQRIALGHTADDRAETLIIRLVRGSGPRGLAVMPPRSPGIEGDIPLIRPLLTVRRSAVFAHCERHELTYATDPSNADARFLRVRVRNEVMPLLEDLSPKVVSHLGAVADMLAALPGLGDDPLEGLGRAQRMELTRTIRQGLRGAAVAIKLRLQGGRALSVQFVNTTKKTEKERKSDKL